MAVQYSPDYLKLPDPLPFEDDDTAPPVEAPIQSASSAEPSTKVLHCLAKLSLSKAAADASGLLHVQLQFIDYNHPPIMQQCKHILP